MIKKMTFITIGLASMLVVSYLLACPGGMGMMNGKGGQMGGMKWKNCMGQMSMKRHRFVMQNGIPAAYQWLVICVWL